MNKQFVPFKGNNTIRYAINCSDSDCPFHLWASQQDQSNDWVITVFTDHQVHCNAKTRPKPPANYFGEALVPVLQREGVLSPINISKRLQRPMAYHKTLLKKHKVLEL
ncbi:hypothetical protein P9112_006116 [Eukaryota sp. TZLM1-RC]